MELSERCDAALPKKNFCFNEEVSVSIISYTYEKIDYFRGYVVIFY